MVQSSSVQPSRVMQLTTRNFPASSFSTNTAPPRASAWSVLCSAFEMFIEMSDAEMTGRARNQRGRGVVIQRVTSSDIISSCDRLNSNRHAEHQGAPELTERKPVALIVPDDGDDFPLAILAHEIEEIDAAIFPRLAARAVDGTVNAPDARDIAENLAVVL